LTDDRASGADDVAVPLYAGGKLRKLRFLMTDNKLDKRLEQERQLNEKNCQRVLELERILRAYKDAVDWMKRNGHEKQLQPGIEDPSCA
jgi:uncharacterized protein YdeI (YjbR/CyaY-like superfamily)